MILLASILIPIIILIIVVFFSTTPKDRSRKDKLFINSIIIGIGAAGCVVISLWSYFTTGKSVDSAWWPVGAFFGSIFIFSIILCLGGVYRNLIHFRKSK